MNKVLFVLPFLPYPLDSGGCQAIYNGIVSAVATGSWVAITYPDCENSEENRNALYERLEGKIHIFPYQVDVNRRGERLLGFVYRFKYNLKKLIKGEVRTRPEAAPYGEWINQMMPKSDSYCRYINNLIAQFDIDIVQCEMLDTLAFALTLPQGVKKYFVHHELGFIRKSQHPFVSQESLAASAHLEINRLIEINLLNRFDTIITLSETDTRKLREAGVTSHIHTSFATINYLPESKLESSSSTMLSFVGPEWHPSNKQGLLWFLESCWTRLLAINPDYRLQIVGGWSKDTSQAWCSKYHHVSFTGFVQDLPATIKNTVMIVPITIGSGIRMKILEAGLIGVPVVTTSVGVEGIPLTDGENCIIADTPDAFVQGILALTDQSLRERFIRSAQVVIAGRYSQSALNKNREILYL